MVQKDASRDSLQSCAKTQVLNLVNHRATVILATQITPPGQFPLYYRSIVVLSNMSRMSNVQCREAAWHTHPPRRHACCWFVVNI